MEVLFRLLDHLAIIDGRFGFQDFAINCYRFLKLIALLGPGCGGRLVALNWKPGGHLKRKLVLNVSAVY